MSHLTRRQLIKAGAAAAGVNPAAAQTASQSVQTVASSTAPVPTGRDRLLLDFDWRFHLGNADHQNEDLDFGAGGETFAKSGGLLKASAENFNDSSWQKVDLPHDWAVELPFENEKSLVSHGCKPLGRNYPGSSIGWYRRVFDIPASDRGRRLRLEFDGVYRNATVIFNGHYLGQNFSGYAPFHFDITDHVNFGGKNVLVVRVDATLSEGWFYEGAGIYRHVWLTKMHPVHVDLWGTFVRPDLRPGAATLHITTEVRNDSDADIQARVASLVQDPGGATIGALRPPAITVPAWQTVPVEHTITVNNPAVWSLESPSLYNLLSSVQVGSEVVDAYSTSFGIRTIKFDVKQGFFLNNEPVKIKGTCNHQDHAGVGAALPDRIQYFRIERLKDMGSNGYRTSHNPPTPELLDACDRIGMLVMDETRMMDSSHEGLSQLERLIRRDRNHPSVIIWSLGNEEREQGSDRGVQSSAP